MNYADADNNGVISFTEFFFFMTIIQLDDRVVKSLFEDDKMDPQEFTKQLTALRRRTKFGANQKDNAGNLLDSRHVKASNEDFLATNKAMVEKIFAGRKEIDINDFFKLKHDILENLWHYEYFQLHDFETEDYKMKAEDFAKSLLIFMPYRMYNQYMA
jgi:hypothetical protein